MFRTHLNRTLLLAITLCGTGCATLHVFTDSKVSKPSRMIESDKIIAFAQIKGEAPSPINAKDAVVVIGENYSYVLDWGKERLIQISTKLEADKLEIDNSFPSFYLDENSISGVLTLKYKPTPNLPYNSPELKLLESLHFQQSFYDRNIFEYRISIKGLKCQKIDLGSMPINSFKKPRPISFYSETQVAPTTNKEKATRLPLAIASDSATLPFQILGGTVLFVVFVTTKH